MATRNASASSMRVSARVKDMEQCSSLKKKRSMEDKTTSSSTKKMKSPPSSVSGSGSSQSKAADSKVPHLLIADDIYEILENIGVDVRNTETGPSLVRSLQQAVNAVSKCIVVDVCSARKKLMASTRHLSVTGDDVANAIKALSTDTERPGFAFYEYIGTCDEEFGIEDKLSAKHRQDMVNKREADQGSAPQNVKGKRQQQQVQQQGSSLLLEQLNQGGVSHELVVQQIQKALNGGSNNIKNTFPVQTKGTSKLHHHNNGNGKTIHNHFAGPLGRLPDDFIQN